ncbi:unnamed protein product, partial [Ectocarpus fasciculatus]
MEESVGDLKASVRKALDGMEELHAKRSNAGAIQDDEDETRKKEQQEKMRLASLSADMERVSKENSVLLQELAKLKASQAAASSTSPSTVQTQAAVVVVKEEPSRPEVSKTVSEDPVARPSNPSPNTSTWELTFPAKGSRQAVVVEVSRRSTCETVCESIAAKLDVADARVVLRDKTTRAMVPLEALSNELQDLYGRESLELEVLQGHVLSDNAVDGLVEFYEQNVPIQAKESSVVGQSMAEIDLAAKRHVNVGQKGKGGDGALLGQWGGDGEDSTDHAEKQVESIRAQLSATLTAGRFPASNTDLSKSVSISRTTPGLGLTTASSVPKAGTNGLGEDDIFGDNEGEDHLSLAELERTVAERKRMRPPGMERQMESVSKSMEIQLNQLLEEAEEELQQLEEDSLGSDTYSSTDPSEYAAVPPLADSTRNGRSFQAMDAEDGRAFGNARQQRNSLEPRSKRPGQGRLEDEDIPKSDWGRTLDTTVSIPEGAEERADQHEANASREHALEHGGIFGDSDSEDA